MAAIQCQLWYRKSPFDANIQLDIMQYFPNRLFYGLPQLRRSRWGKYAKMETSRVLVDQE